MNSEQLASLEEALRDYVRILRPCFKQDRTFKHLQDYSVGLLADLQRKSIEPIALAAGVDERTLQCFLSSAVWDHRRAQDILQQMVADRHDVPEPIGIVDASAHPKSGTKTPGVQRQWCGQLGKSDNCVVGQHLLYTDNHPDNPFSCMLASDLFLPESWSDAPQRRREAGIPDDLVHRTKWRIALAQVEQALGNGIRFAWLTFDADYGTVPAWWFGLDRLGLRGVGEVRPNFYAWARPPSCRSGRAEHAPKRVDNLVAHSPAFTQQPWEKIHIKTATRGPVVWEVKAARVQLVAKPDPGHGGHSVPTDRRYWLIAARNPEGKDIKFIVSNAPACVPLKKLLEVAWARWHIEKWFERAKQEAGFGSFEVRTYDSVIRHWLISRIAMLFLAEQTVRLRGEKSADHVRAGGQRGERGGVVRVEPQPAVPRGSVSEDAVLPTA